MITLNIRPSDLKKLESDIKRVQQSAKEEYKKEIHRSALHIESTAKRLCPSNDGRLRSSIASKLDQQNPTAEVGTNVFYAPYVEFGTGQYAKQYLGAKPKELQQYAMTFFVNGKGYHPEKPYLYPAIQEETPRLIERLKRIKP